MKKAKKTEKNLIKKEPHITNAVISVLIIILAFMTDEWTRVGIVLGALIILVLSIRGENPEIFKKPTNKKNK